MSHDSYPPFSRLYQFIEKETRIVCDPLNLGVNKLRIASKSEKQAIPVRAHTLASHTNEN